MTDNSSKIDSELQALLADVSDEKERARLIKAWQALAPLAGKSCAPPAPSRELERIFAGNGEEMTDDELHLLAAAGFMHGTENNDTLTGSHAQDFIEGLGGDDQIDGDYGDDWIDGGEGNDTLTGGEGSDTFHFTLNDGDNVITDFDPENDVLHLTWDPEARGKISYDKATGNTIITYPGGSITVEGVRLGTSHLLFEIHGSDGNDTLAAHNGVNISYGGDGDDTIYGKGGDDVLDGGEGNDTISGGDDNDVVFGGGGDDSLDGDQGDDTMHGGSGNDTMNGGTGNDEMHGNEDDDVLNGGAGDDTLHGDEGDDRLYGGFGDEADVLTGGEGSDTYVFSSDSGTDTVTDFNPEEDYLDFLGADDISNISVSHDESGNTVVTFGDTTIILEGVTMTQEEVWARRATE